MTFLTMVGRQIFYNFSSSGKSLSDLLSTALLFWASKEVCWYYFLGELDYKPSETFCLLSILSSAPKKSCIWPIFYLSVSNVSLNKIDHQWAGDCLFDLDSKFFRIFRAKLYLLGLLFKFPFIFSFGCRTKLTLIYDFFSFLAIFGRARSLF